MAHRDELEAIIAAVVAGLSADELERLLERAGVAHARMNDVTQLSQHPVLAGRDRWQDIHTPGGPAGALPPPAILAGVEPLMGSVPALGSHSRKILSDLGYSADELDDLVVAGVTTT